MDERQKAELEMHAALLSYYRSPKRNEVPSREVE